MTSTFETLLLEVDDSGICTLIINRPDKLNALNTLVFEELSQALDKIESDSAIKGLIVTGTGDKAFVAGADIKELTDLSASEAKAKSENGHEVFQRIENSVIPVIAAVNGYALGGGCELAMACHIRIGSPNAVLGLPEVGLGLIPGYGGSQRLPELVGKAKALELIMTGNHIKADEALAIGLLNQVAETSALEDSKKMLQNILKKGPLAIKSAILAVHGSAYDSGYQKEAKLFGELFDTADFKEGTSAFLEKRKPNFSGK